MWVWGSMATDQIGQLGDQLGIRRRSMMSNQVQSVGLGVPELFRPFHAMRQKVLVPILQRLQWQAYGSGQ